MQHVQNDKNCVSPDLVCYRLSLITFRQVELSRNICMCVRDWQTFTTFKKGGNTMHMVSSLGSQNSRGKVIKIRETWQYSDCQVLTRWASDHPAGIQHWLGPAIPTSSLRLASTKFDMLHLSRVSRTQSQDTCFSTLVIACTFLRFIDRDVEAHSM
jgi:hypothetical protein